MRRWMHTCYSLVTNEGSQTLILKSQPSLELLHFLELERCFSANQMSKRPLKEVEGMYLYTPQSIPTVTCQLSKKRVDRTRRSMATVEIETSSAEWPDAPIRDDRTHPIVQGPYCTLTRRSVESDQWWPDASGQRSTLLEHNWAHCGRVRSFSSRVRLVHLPSVTRVNTINASSPRKDHVRSTKLKRSDCQHWPDASGQDRDRVRSRVNGSNDFETRRNLNRVASNWTLGFTWAT
jgi:hypothetical protein